jgi:hypothetical protein
MLKRGMGVLWGLITVQEKSTKNENNPSYPSFSSSKYWYVLCFTLIIKINYNK